MAEVVAVVVAAAAIERLVAARAREAPVRAGEEANRNMMRLGLYDVSKRMWTEQSEMESIYVGQCKCIRGTGFSEKVRKKNLSALKEHRQEGKRWFAIDAR